MRRIVHLLIISIAIYSVNSFALDSKVYNARKFMEAKLVGDDLQHSEIKLISDGYATTLVLPVDVYLTLDLSIAVEKLQYVDSLVKILNDARFVGRNIEVIGHSDDIGSSSGKERVSYDYARVVADYLVVRGVNYQRLVKLDGVGDKYPLVANNSTVNRHINRRVEIRLLDQTPPKLAQKAPSDQKTAYHK